MNSLYRVVAVVAVISPLTTGLFICCYGKAVLFNVRVFVIPPEEQLVSDFSASVTLDHMRTADWCVWMWASVVWLALSFFYHKTAPVVHLGLTGAD